MKLFSFSVVASIDWFALVMGRTVPAFLHLVFAFSRWSFVALSSLLPSLLWCGLVVRWWRIIGVCWQYAERWILVYDMAVLNVLFIYCKSFLWTKADRNLFIHDLVLTNSWLVWVFHKKKENFFLERGKTTWPIGYCQIIGERQCCSRVSVLVEVLWRRLVIFVR